MQYRKLGRTGLNVSVLCLGTMNFGPHTEEKDAFAIMDRALDEGINFFDTANVYGRAVHFGHTEEVIGRWFAQGGGRREKVILATKVYGPMAEKPWPNEGSGLSAAKIRCHCEDSLRRLQTDCIELYQMHHIAREAPWEEVWEAFEVLRHQGKIVYAGSSNFGGWHIAQASERARARHYLGLVSEQSRYNLHVRMPELEVLPACEHYGLGIIPWSPLAGGLLGGVLEKTEGGRRASEPILGLIKKHHDQLVAYEDLCRELGQPPAVVALAWLLSRPVVSAPIIGPRTMDQLTSCLPAAEFKVPELAMKKLDEIWPGPGGTAPEAYAW